MAEKRTREKGAAATAGKAGAGKRGAEAGEARKARPSGAASAPAGRKAASKSRSGETDRDRRVRERAYEIWEQEGRPSGRERDHWERADREVGK